MTSGSPVPGRSRRAALLVTLRTWLLPVALGACAFGLHYALHVPAGPLPPPSPAELEENKKAADKKKRDDDKKKRDADKKAGKAKPERPGPRDLPYEAFSRPRDRYLLEQLWAYYEPKGFSKEPAFDAWHTAHKPLVSQIVNATRQLALPDGPAVSVATSECHTIRCRFVLNAPTPEALEQMSAAIGELKLGDESLWHSVQLGKVTAEPSKREGVESKHRLEFTVGFIRDLPPIGNIVLPGKGPLRVPPPPRPTLTPGAPAKPGPATGPAGPAGSATPVTMPAKPKRSAPVHAVDPNPTPK